MIARRTNTYSSATRVPPAADRIDGRPLPTHQIPYFRSLWRKRGQWIPLCLLQEDVGDMNRARTEHTLNQMIHTLPIGFTLEKKIENVFSGTDEEMRDEEAEHLYYRLTTEETLPAPVFTGVASDPETADEHVPFIEVTI